MHHFLFMYYLLLRGFESVYNKKPICTWMIKTINYPRKKEDISENIHEEYLLHWKGMLRAWALQLLWILEDEEGKTVERRGSKK